MDRISWQDAMSQPTSGGWAIPSVILSLVTSAATGGGRYATNRGVTKPVRTSISAGNLPAMKTLLVFLLGLDVGCQDGTITLSGSVASEALIGKAVALALDSEGVRHVKSKLTVQARKK